MSFDLIDRLAAHRTLANIPRPQLEWLAAHGEIRRYEVDYVFPPHGDAMVYLLIMLSGRITISLDHGAGLRKVTEWAEGDITGTLPFSRMNAAPGLPVVEEAVELLAVHRDEFPALVRECYELTGVLVHVMVDRARLFRSTALQDEKMLSLGKLAAGLAHELNNPASSVERNANSLARALAEIDAASRGMAAACLADDQLAEVSRLQKTIVEGQRFSYKPIELADREDSLSDWLDAHGLDTTAAESFAETTMTIEALDHLASVIGRPALATVVKYLAADYAVRRLASDIEMAATRIHTLVAAVKGFTYMDQPAVPTPVDVGKGLSDTLTVLRSKARQKSVDLRLNLDPALPRIDGFGGELNQVWGNLIDNAIDAVPKDGHVTVSATCERQAIVVRVADDGPGIPEAVLGRIFDPFFTTKGVGKGTGLGLETARRIVLRHDGQIDVTSGPGGTEFKVTLPFVRRPSSVPADAGKETLR